MSGRSEIVVEPTPPSSWTRVTRLLMAKYGQLTCRHFYRLVKRRDAMFLKCDFCDAETEGFQIGPPRGWQ